MKQKNKVSEQHLINLAEQQHWYQAAVTHFGGVEQYLKIVVEQIAAHLIQAHQLTIKSKICIVCADQKRFLLVSHLYQVLLEQNINVEIWTLESYVNVFADLKVRLTQPIKIDLLIDCIASLDAQELSPGQCQLIQAAEKVNGDILALECPSGLDPNTGAIGAGALSADFTLSLGAYFQGLWTGYAREYVGQLCLLPVFPEYDGTFPVKLMPKFTQAHRQAFVHKHLFATVVVIAGQASMFGAAILAARAALVMGAGLVKIFYPQGSPVSVGLYPELMLYPQKQTAAMCKQLQPDDIIIFGPGLGEDEWAKFVWRMMISLDNRMVVDASALKFLAQQPSHRPKWILTPHPGEAATLLNTNVNRIQADRFAAIQQLKAKYAATCILKGSGTLVIDDKDNIAVCPLGNPGMASPGMGDVLAGLVAGAWAQGLEPSQAAITAVALHAESGDKVAQRSLNHVALASQVIDYIQEGNSYHD